MSRSSGPNGQVRGVAPQQWQQHPEPDPAVQQAFAAVQAAAQARYQQAAQPPQHPTFGNVQPSDPRAGYGAPQGQYQQPQMPAAPPAYRPPAPTDSGFYGAPAAPPQPQQQSYQPVFERYAAPQPAAHQQAYDPRTAPPQPQAYAPPPAQRAPAEPQPSPYDSHFQQRQDRAPAADLRGGVFDKWPPQGSHQQPAPPPAPASRGYDFASYGTPAAADFGRAPQTGHPHQPPASDYRAAAGHVDSHADGQWQLGSPYDQDDRQAGGQYAAGGQPGIEDGGYAGDATGQLQPATEQDFDPDDHPDYEDDEPRRGRKGLIMVSALVGAIALGGGLAFAYKRFVKPGTVTTAQVNKVSAPTGPSKTQPADRGGKQFPNQDSKLQSRLGDGTAQPAAAAAAAAPAADVEGGVKRVPTVVIGRDGSVSAPAASAAVPGMVVVQPSAPPPAAAATVAAATASAPPTAAAAVPAPPQPRVAAVVPQAPRAPVAVVNAVPPVAEPVAAPPPPAPRKTVRKAAAPRDDLAAATATGTATAATTTAAAPQAAAARRTSGFVAVLASKGSKAEAERANSEFEQRFDVLKGKVFDVQEANLTTQGKGIYYRSVVGPPGSREYASGVCTQLKAAGYTGCWITAY